MERRRPRRRSPARRPESVILSREDGGGPVRNEHHSWPTGPSASSRLRMTGESSLHVEHGAPLKQLYCLNTTPSFITNRTSFNAFTSRSGSLATAITSAYAPG